MHLGEDAGKSREDMPARALGSTSQLNHFFFFLFSIFLPLMVRNIGRHAFAQPEDLWRKSLAKRARAEIPFGRPRIHLLSKSYFH